MASILKVDELRGIVSAGDITVTSEGGAATQSLQQGLAKSWINLDGTASGATARDSFNVASTTDNGTGQYTATFTNSMTNDDYAHNVTARGASIVFGSIRDGSYATSTMGMYIFNTGGSLTDATYVIAALHGDLA